VGMTMIKNNKIAVMASGKGSNLQALLAAIAEGSCSAQIQLVITNKPDAMALQVAKNAGVPHVLYLNPKDYADRESYDLACVKTIQDVGCQWVVLAGYMRILSAVFIQAFPNRIINVHPSLLPSFVGADAVGDAFAHGVKVTGCTVHFVTEDLDSGPILGQTSVPILDDDDKCSLHQRIQREEHKLLPAMMAQLLSVSFEVVKRKVVWKT